jgi:hypothetical protein
VNICYSFVHFAGLLGLIAALVLFNHRHLSDAMPIEIQFPDQGDSVADRLRQMLMHHRNGASRVIIMTAWVGRGFLREFRGILIDILETNPSCTIEFIIGTNINTPSSSPEEMREILAFVNDTRWGDRCSFLRHTVPEPTVLFHPKMYGILAERNGTSTGATLIGSPNATGPGMGFSNRRRHLEIYAWTNNIGENGVSNLISISDTITNHQNTSSVEDDWISQYERRRNQEREIRRQFRTFRDEHIDVEEGEASESSAESINEEEQGNSPEYHIDFETASITSIINSVHDFICDDNFNWDENAVVSIINQRRGGDGHNHNSTYVNGVPLLAAYFIHSESNRRVLDEIRTDPDYQIQSSLPNILPRSRGTWVSNLRTGLITWLEMDENRAILVDRIGGNEQISILDLLSRIPPSWGGTRNYPNTALAHIAIILAHLQNGITRDYP